MTTQLLLPDDPEASALLAEILADLHAPPENETPAERVRRIAAELREARMQTMRLQIALKAAQDELDASLAAVL